MASPKGTDKLGFGHNGKKKSKSSGPSFGTKTPTKAPSFGTKSASSSANTTGGVAVTPKKPSASQRAKAREYRRETPKGWTRT